MPTLTITRGYPGCGKTSWANALVKTDPQRITRISRDDIRFGILNIDPSAGVGTNQQETQVSKIHAHLVEELLCSGRDVIVDDTNLQLKTARKWADLAQRKGASFAVMDFEIPVETCISRNNIRVATGGRYVPEKVIRSMAAKHPFPFLPIVPSEVITVDYTYIPNKRMPAAFIFDIDGTLAQMDGRGPYDWHKVGTDKLVEPVARMLDILRSNGYGIVVMSGRDGACFDATEKWLTDHGIKCSKLIMRAPGDTRKDSIVKLELFQSEVAPYFQVLGTFDDRNQVVEMWRAIGLTCFQVADGAF